MEKRGEWEGLWGLKVADGWAFVADWAILIQQRSRSQAKNPCSVSKPKPSKEFKSGVWIEEGVASVVGGGGGAEEVIESEDEIKVIEDVEEVEVEDEVDVSVGVGVGGCAGRSARTGASVHERAGERGGEEYAVAERS